MFKQLHCLAIYTKDLESAILFYEKMGLVKKWEAEQIPGKPWKLVGMGFEGGHAELVLKNNPELHFIEPEIFVEDVTAFYEQWKDDPSIQWIRPPFSNSLGGHVAIMEAPDGNVFVLIGK
ncbi:VOC family protein [Brevibacillus laterosporus]|uniref:Glyoxalase-like domain protein n=1 Tax=Brevibacillus laterosporus LMG 15441 TaxID=1042163 RepID=A0A075R588_BRELA|nr:VOC family protein [Brevibacillus laterosporus]AIG26338.1 glyoxalase-like domain protein [Brevibacillus laterosporus LMG 15441]RJL08378.1 glyoxalase [Brevibacillus laterosporus]TPH13502.1 VOC family protein [Brevibacillus laterosporus]